PHTRQSLGGCRVSGRSPGPVREAAFHRGTGPRFLARLRSMYRSPWPGARSSTGRYTNGEVRRARPGPSGLSETAGRAGGRPRGVPRAADPVERPLHAPRADPGLRDVALGVAAVSAGVGTAAAPRPAPVGTGRARGGWAPSTFSAAVGARCLRGRRAQPADLGGGAVLGGPDEAQHGGELVRSEERRVGKDARSSVLSCHGYKTDLDA